MSTQPPRTARRPGRRLTVLAATAASALLIGATRTTWTAATAPDLTGAAQSVAVTGADAAPAVLALAIVALAAALATSLSSTWVRFVTGPVLIASGLGAAWTAFAVHRDPVSASGSAVSSATGVVGSELSATATVWPLLAVLLGLVLVVLGVVVLIAGRSWPVGTRYRSPAVAAPSDPSRDPAAAWDALTRGEDPSLGPEDEEPSASSVEVPAAAEQETAEQETGEQETAPGTRRSAPDDGAARAD
ncbi:MULTISPECIES: Trp biosynthesis-associated membrane protein [Brachybacterium]|uniref:Trp biosynthesis protein n=1 Tax=Brachybacterium alimentarium TaxID=47845 RepID=A0A2A3YDT8_9MICO|nr:MULTISPECIES: Trp biosynthesis-associated membrane protein [Brachybacterium]PCC36158.1 hypothetical protein CIK71_00335 [Brachybacterium alimentarium]PCC37932.1 hypothetical protein CIK66_16680 [Brachybacterium alimentarium]RCS67055.1 hypothetical protein CIK81_01360 [Brachybacterium sp. JB7]RCS68499.1 hypothetical protein CIK73_08330 [Brachybacterium alimentarium]RCS76987.1 hypothetical protein CIK68_01045 [Brachybacterium alimentarium]